jgi:SSS family solute:Na+ symporter
MSRDLLLPGFIGLMLVGILAANMSTLDAGSVAISALFIRNIYQPLSPGKTETHYLWVGRVTIAVALLGGIGAALYIDNLLELFKYFITIPAIFGAPIWLGFIWRRLTRTAVVVEIIICFTIFAILPNLFQGLEWARTNPAFHGPDGSLHPSLQGPGDRE